jgi:hypothetical protein
VVPVERPLSGGIVLKKPLPRDYGFLDESQVQRAILAEKQRKKRINQISLFSFLIVFIVASVAVLVILGLVVFSSNLGHPLMWLLVGTISAGTGFVLGTSCWLVARAFSGRTHPPSTEYGKAKQYLDANWLWKRRLQREYGYESL